MICRHAPGDRSCSSNNSSPYYYQPTEKIVYKEVTVTPDADKYTIEEVHREGQHLVLKVKYPNCAKCSYEGTKIMVFLNVSESSAIKWKKIDPHFSEPNKGTNTITAPSPAARFPASIEGWDDAIAFAKYKNK